MVLLAGVGLGAGRGGRPPPGQRVHPSRRAARHRRRGSGAHHGAGVRRSSSAAWRRTASRSASSTPPRTCRRSRSSTATAGRSCPRSTARGPSAAWWAPDSRWRWAPCPCGRPPRSRSSRSRALFAAYLPREHGEATVAAAEVAVPWRPILLVGLGMVVFYMVDTASQTWGPTYLDDAFIDAGVTGRAGDVPLPAREPGGPARGRRAGRQVRRRAGAADRRGRRQPGAAGRRDRADLARRGAGVHAARRRRLGGRAAELLGRGPDRRRPGCGPGRRRRGDRPLQPVQLPGRAARVGAHRAGRLRTRCATASRCPWCSCWP